MTEPQTRGLEDLSANDLSELRRLYSEAYMEPVLEDAVTESINRMIDKGK